MVEGAPRRAQKSRSGKDGEIMVRRRTHLSVVLGITFCVTGGALVASSFILEWVLLASGGLTLWDLLGLGGAYLLAALVPLSGALVAMLSALDILAEKGRKGFKAPSSLGALAFALLGVISIIIVALQIETDYVSSQEASFGPALFMSVFGGVLALSGGMVLTMDYLEARARRGRFTASGGSAQLKAALRPAGGARKARAEPMGEEGYDEALASKEARDAELNAPAPSGLECPNCYSPVQPNWQICPICGQQLL